MACFIRHNDNFEHKIVEVEWTLANYMPKIDNLCVIEIEASGIELKHIMQLFHNLMRPPKYDKILWEGELARLIWGIMTRR